MIRLIDRPVAWQNGVPRAYDTSENNACAAPRREGTIASRILRAHDLSGGDRLRVKFDALISHDITYVGVIQTARASGLSRFPVPYVLTNCHNSLCAVGGTINEDDHAFGLSAAIKYGGIYVPANMAVIHQYAREMLAGCGRMILGSDSHTRYGALGTLGIGEGGPEIVKQLLGDTYDIAAPRVLLVYLTGAPGHGVGPHDVALALCGAVYKNGFAKNRILEFAGPGVGALPMDFRIGIDVMTTETACLSSVWATDGRVEEYLAAHGRAAEYKPLAPEDGALYDGMIEIDLSRVEPMCALPFHPSEAYPIRELCANAGDILRAAEKRVEERFEGRVRLRLTDKIAPEGIRIDQGIIAGCAGGMYDNIAEAAAILRGRGIGSGYFSLSVYPPSMPVNLRLSRDGILSDLMEAGAVIKPCFCGPCFGAGDVPANGALSVRHTTRNFPNREGSRPGEGQLAGVMLLDARSIAATARNGGVLTSAADIDYESPAPQTYSFDADIYQKRCYFGFGRADADAPLRFGPNIADWPKIPAMPENLVLRLAAVIRDPVTTTDELIPSGETSSYRSNPMRLASFTLSRREPAYVERTQSIREIEEKRAAGDLSALRPLLDAGIAPDALRRAMVASVVFANRPGDGSAREQAASCQRVLGGGANICYEYATKRYRSNLLNWGMLPFRVSEDVPFPGACGEYIYIPDVRARLLANETRFPALLIGEDGTASALDMFIDPITDAERDILLSGCLMNDYANRRTDA